MDGAGDQLLSRPGLADDEHRRVRALGDLGNELHEVLEGLTLGDEAGLVFLQIGLLQGLHLFAQADGLKGAANGQFQGVHDNGFDHIVIGALLHGGDHGGGVLIGRDHDHQAFRQQAFYPPQGIDAVHARQADIQEHQVGPALLDHRQRSFGRGEAPDGVGVFQGHGNAVPDGLLVVDDIDRIVDHTDPSCASGSSIMNSAPPRPLSSTRR
ncbi:MAG: hypothetical protein BWY77_00940 [bacterium ADurb.Bin431]|nr:MAG: hypothetical protein BWY77_00940 [bacterium ADurb.Bin431]